jgi:phosphate transport system substrate-binding protein
MTSVAGRLFAIFAGLVVSSAAASELRIAGSDTLESMFLNAVGQYTRTAGADFKVSQNYKGTGAGFKEACDGKVDIVPASSALDADTARRCKVNGVELLELPLAFDAVVVVANPSRAGLGELTPNELKVILHPESAGRVQRWSQVRANLPDVPLNVISLDPRSGTVAFMTQKLHGLRGFIRHDAKATHNHEEVLRQVAADPGAIGYVSLASLAESKAAVWKVPVNFGSGPVVASRESLLNGSYGAYSRLMYVYVNKASLNAKNNASRDFLRWMLERGAKLAQYEGFVPLIEANYQEGLRKLGTSAPN